MEAQSLPFYNPLKRKWDSCDEGSNAATHPCIQTAPRDHYTHDSGSTGSNSPGAIMTGKLENLDIHAQTPNSMDEGRSRGQTPLEIDIERERTLNAHDNAGVERPSSKADHSLLNGVTVRNAISNDQNDNSTPPLPSSPSSRRTGPKQHSHPTPKKRKKSPPLRNTLDINPLTWHESEITGHNPTDPADDGYGINGVGFKPTAAIAWERSQRRKKQIEEWKRREAREAREKRKERRDGIVSKEVPSASPSKKRVSFVT
ncbi:hypothetical protein VTO42DRAFT_935 [Malbranchea cinnamomea]